MAQAQGARWGAHLILHADGPRLRSARYLVRALDDTQERAAAVLVSCPMRRVQEEVLARVL